MVRTLGGKWVWIWNWRRCDGGDAKAVADRLRRAGCTGAIVKAFDGPRWFDQLAPWREIARALRQQGLPAVGAWGYLYGADPAREAQRAIETVQYGEVDFLVLDVESEFKTPAGAEAAFEICRRLRAALGPDYPLYFSTFAIARYHAAFPFTVFRDHCAGALPQIYWNAFRRWPVDEALAMTYEDYARLGISAERVLPVAGLYREGTVNFPLPQDVSRFAQVARDRGSPAVSFWSYEHMSDEMWEAVAAADDAAEEGTMSSTEFQEAMRAVADLAARVDRVEARVSALSIGPLPVEPPPAPRTYTVQPGDTLSGIAARFSLPGWRDLYEANAAVIGPDPNRIYPGQVLIVPRG